MRNTRRRKRRKSPSRTKKNSSKKAVQALVAGALIAAGTQAYADPIRFDNPPGPGHFEWPVPQGDNTNWLDLTQGAEAQPGTPWGDSTLRHIYSASDGSVGTTGSCPVRVQVVYNYFLEGVDFGELIPTSGLGWGISGYTFYPGYGSWLPEGQATYLGAKFDVGAGYQYAWIGVVRTGMTLDAFAWGYETEPGVAIPAGIPEPGTLAALALGAAAALTCRRRVRSQID